MSNPLALVTVPDPDIQFNFDRIATGTLPVTAVSVFMRTLLDDASASAALATLGFSTYIKTLIDDADASAARSTLGVAQKASAFGAVGSTTSVTSGAANALALTEVYDPNSTYNSANGVWTPGVAGTYEVNCFARPTDTAAASWGNTNRYLRVSLWKNSSAHVHFGTFFSPTTGAPGPGGGGSVVVVADADDFYELVVLQNSGSTMADWDCGFSAHKID